MTWLLSLRSKITGWAVAIAAALAILAGLPQGQGGQRHKRHRRPAQGRQ
ncbi:hypothetical protein [Brucella intermedia]|nr:hypothetical protein [Brucella intermedia]SUA86637.1 Uncharacterised protein [Brucella intermedia]